MRKDAATVMMTVGWTVFIVLALGNLFLARAGAEPVEDTVMVEMQRCLFEDGHPNGKPCLWIDPDTADAYLSLSENYWTDNEGL